ncbi:Cas1p-domain-containing protein [Obba rivulosa]|uniref:Cas1p-domain-containing protein n=1 Tax=Obba rivulosa TaxID=1052685 RepID=A0A8E2DS21_9APHY|nr:Cas1p-domain-containing protein [Obba rivulosa]
MVPRRWTLSVNPLWTHYIAWASVALAVALGLVRYVIIDRVDPLHCDALLTEGQWLDTGFRNWQPEGCMLHAYQPKDAATCMRARRVVFVGDSVTRQLFFQFAHAVDPGLPTAPPDDEHKHIDYTFNTDAGIQLMFYWDPYLNTSHTQGLISPSGVFGDSPETSSDRPALLVLGAGLWYIRYEDSGGLPAWEAKMESTLNTLARALILPADTVVVLPIEDVVPSKLSRERASTMHASDIDAMNSDLNHRIRPPASRDPFTFFSLPASHGEPIPVALPLVFNQMLDPSQTEDGLHFSDTLVKAQANILLNLRCNDVLPKTFPIDKTCCRSYPHPTPLHAVVLAAAFLWGPVCWMLSRRLSPRTPGQSIIREEDIPAVVISAAAALIFIADRTGFWLKEQKQFNSWIFATLCLCALGFGLFTIKGGDKDLGFLNREQTDEWKGWMQIAILIYHYTGASKVSGIYNPIRVLVASYLFMTGYGHTTFYVKKADFGFQRVAQVMIRLNLLTLLLAYVMNTDYISYYFAPLVSMWYLIIYGTMFAGAKYNDRTVFLVAKILVSMGLATWFMSEPSLLEIAFQFLERICGIHWSAREWAFRVNLDLWIVYFGMFAALAVIKIREYRLTDHPHWPLAVKVSIGVSAAVMLWYFAFELYQPDKFVYNLWHPYISFLPVGAFVVLRNASGILRSGNSRFFAFIGTCSLETFIIQYHLWLAGDTKGILLVFPGTRWRPLNFIITTVMFIYVSHRVAQATGDITNWICGSSKPPSLPTTNQPSSSNTGRRNVPTAPPEEEGQEVIFLAPSDDGPVPKDNNGNPLPLEPDTPMRPQRRWVDRLAEGSQSPPGFRVWYGETEWTPGLKIKLAIALAAMWLLNIMWPYPYGVPVS